MAAMSADRSSHFNVEFAMMDYVNRVPRLDDAWPGHCFATSALVGQWLNNIDSETRNMPVISWA
jgi:hypothetical protein